jgi:hypothetical protein
VKLWCYVVAQDHGFAPNPFHGVCTLATCKPMIREHADLGDWVLGMGSKEIGCEGRVVYIMRVTDESTFDDYWRDPRFAAKKPIVSGSFMQRFGDNIYHRQAPGTPWIQADSRHSRAGGVTNHDFLRTDTGTTDRVLLSDDYIYWGARAPALPPDLAIFGAFKRGVKHRFPAQAVEGLLRWRRERNERGWVGNPVEWREDRVRRWR